VARVRERAEHAEVVFYESARIYRLPRTNPAYQEMLGQLQAAAAAGTLVYVRFIQPNGDVIGSIRSD
jgi:hypothetical protein